MGHSLVSVVAVLLPVLARLVAALDQVIYFGHITSFGSFGFNSSGAVPAIQLAQDLINSDPGILSGYLLNSTQVMDSEVRARHEGQGRCMFILICSACSPMGLSKSGSASEPFRREKFGSC